MYFPQSSMRRARPSKQTQKLFFYPFSRKRRLIWSIRIVSQETDKNYWLSRCGQAEWCSSSADSIKWRVDQSFVPSMTTCSSTVTVPQHSNHTQNCVTDDWISSSWISTYASTYCLEFYQQPGCSWGLWQPLASGSKQRNGHLHHMSDSTCIQTNDTLLVFIYYLTTTVKKKNRALPISFLWVYDSHKAQEHHPVSDDLKCIPLSSISGYRPPKTCITCSYWSTVGMTY